MKYIYIFKKATYKMNEIKYYILNIYINSLFYYYYYFYFKTAIFMVIQLYQINYYFNINNIYKNFKIFLIIIH